MTHLSKAILALELLAVLTPAACSSDDRGGVSAGVACDKIVSANCAHGPDREKCVSSGEVVTGLARGAGCETEEATVVACYSSATWKCVDDDPAPEGCEGETSGLGRCLGENTPGTTALCATMVALGCAIPATHAACTTDVGEAMVVGAVQGCSAHGEALRRCLAAAGDWICGDHGVATAPSCDEQWKAFEACL